MALLQLNIPTGGKREVTGYLKVPNENKILPLPAWADRRGFLPNCIHSLLGGHLFLPDYSLSPHFNGSNRIFVHLVTACATTLKTSEQLPSCDTGANFYISGHLFHVFNAEDLQLVHTNSPRVVSFLRS